MTRLAAAAALIALGFGAAGCSAPVEQVLESNRSATWRAMDGSFSMAVEATNTGSYTIVFGDITPVNGFEEVETSVLVGEVEALVDDPPGLRPVPTEVVAGETAYIYVTLRVTNCDELGDWEKTDDDTVRFTTSIGEEVMIDVWKTGSPDEATSIGLGITPALQISELDLKVCS